MLTKAPSTVIIYVYGNLHFEAIEIIKKNKNIKEKGKYITLPING